MIDSRGPSALIRSDIIGDESFFRSFGEAVTGTVKKQKYQVKSQLRCKGEACIYGRIYKPSGDDNRAAARPVG
jgi:hypothetical protein